MIHSTPHCCKYWPKIAMSFWWMELEDDPDVKVMPHTCTGTERIRVNFCPSCGKSRRMVVNRESDWNLYKYD